MVSEKNFSLQECQRSELSSEVNSVIQAVFLTYSMIKYSMIKYSIYKCIKYIII